ncbi:TetR/AcrR family transcriptional regulator [Paucibacter sp. R3-3]|uniref:TetR/AcrR family transcriptional regulator n=1 Tax=Roseateles agri TaxID=3098619 RepID=A0ABU5DPA2_9BURK|nr:TetR/AcrR family transcriptional regulator [Paucibacter sp. R3-3]MDY0748144.1 TetR/AcrR family transcriptional regulator [Paucibacter sp. R3-3]
MPKPATTKAATVKPPAKPAVAPVPPAAAPAAVAAAPAAAPVRRKRRNKRSEETIETILVATEQIVLESGASRISILDVCKLANVSRGTFYRYFSSQDDLLDAFSRHKRDGFHRSLQQAVEPFADPDERFDALLAYLERYLEHGNARRLLLVAPDYALSFFKRIFHDAVVRFEDVLRPVFDAWDDRLGARIDRELVCEMLIRYVLSEQLVSGSTERHSLPRRVTRMITTIMGAGVVRTRR